MEQPPTLSHTRRVRRIYTIFPVLVPLIILLVTTYRGIDFGFHWDEHVQIELMEKTVSSGTFLPSKFYNYPSMSYWLCVASIIPAYGSAVIHGPKTTEEVARRTQGLSSYVRSQQYLLQTRMVFATVASLTVLWVYLLVLTWRGNWQTALAAGSLLALSWEIAYHIRWIAPDAIMMQFGALTMFCAFSVRVKENKRLWLRLAAAAAGLAAGSKYPGGLMLIPVLVAARQTWNPTSSQAGFRRIVAEAIGIFLIAYLVSTPGTLLEPIWFIRCVLVELEHYRHGHLGHTISPGPIHFAHELMYFSLTLFSAYRPIAPAIFACSILGAFVVWRESRQTTTLLFSFPLIYLLYMCLQRAFVVRNLLVIAPFLAILAALGVEALVRRARRRIQKYVVAGVCTAISIVNGLWLVRAAETIRETDPNRFVSEAAHFMAVNSDTTFLISERIYSELNPVARTKLSNAKLSPADNPSNVMLYASEGFIDPYDWPATDVDMIERQFGPLEVNFNCYPNWKGRDRIIVMSIEKARRASILVLRR